MQTFEEKFECSCLGTAGLLVNFQQRNDNICEILKAFIIYLEDRLRFRHRLIQEIDVRRKNLFYLINLLY